MRSLSPTPHYRLFVVQDDDQTATDLSPPIQLSKQPPPSWRKTIYGYDNCLQSTKSLGGFGSWASTIAEQGWRKTGWDG